MRTILWLLVTILVLLACVVTSLRVMLPQLDRFQPEIQYWVNKNSGFEFQIEQVSGFWRNTHPSLSLIGMQASAPEQSEMHLSAAQIDIEFDLIHSILQMQPVVADLSIHGLKLDISSIDWLSVASGDDSPQQASSSDQNTVERINNLFLRQLDDFSVFDSRLVYQAVDGGIRELDISRLQWRNFGRRHLAEGIVSIADANLNSLSVSANFVDNGSLTDISGEFYVSAQNIRVTPWLTKYLKEETGIESGQVSFNSWLTLQNNRPTNAYVELEPSELSWKDEEKHDLIIESGVFQLSPKESGWIVNGHSLQVRTDDTPWPSLDVAFDWQPEQWRLNVSQLDIAALTPIVKLIPESEATSEMLETLKLGGLVEDLRVSMGSDIESLRYSADLSRGTIAQWELLPGIHHLSASIHGGVDQAVASVSLIDDVLPYGDVFQAPLNMKQAQVDIVWQKAGDDWSLWADKVTAATPDLQVLGAFRLDFPKDKSPFLSFYAEADLYNASETWRYLPTLALGRSLTDYLSTAIQAGRVNTSKLIWYGELGNFPYHDNNGMFQAWVGLKDAKFSFDTAWPPITDLQLDLLFQNDAMYLDSHDATLMDVQGQRITGRIPELSGDGHIEIEAKAKAKGNAVRDYMTSSPLVDSVGAALTAVQVSGDVSSEFQLFIPFDDREARAWGYADLNSNHVEIETPPMTLESVSGRIEFDNDVVTGAGLEANLLEQPVSIDFAGENAGSGYAVAIDVLGDWEVEPLYPYVGERWLSRLDGHAQWHTEVDIQLNDVGFTYQVDLVTDLKGLSSDYPAPLKREVGTEGQLKLQASGNQETITARLELPQAKYQAEIDIRPDTPVLKATNLILGNGSFKISPVVGHQMQVRTHSFDLDSWLEYINQPVPQKKAALDEMNTPTIPSAKRVDINAKEVLLGGVTWNDVDFSARKKALGWHMELDSQEAKGEANYIEPYDLTVSLERLHLNLENSKTDLGEKSFLDTLDKEEPLISDFDRHFHQHLPNLTVRIDDFWLQGYKVGQANMDLQRRGNKLVWEDMTFVSGSNKVSVQGEWALEDELSIVNSALVLRVIITVS